MERQHERSVGLYVRGIVKQLGLYPSLGRTLQDAVRFHDIGEQFVPSSVLLKQGPLTAEEWLLVQRHPRVGAEIVRAADESSDVVAAVRSHHERLDGRGYPDRLRGEAIPLAARILAVADSFDAITSYRPYRDARSWLEALNELERVAGAQLDPVCVAALRRYLEDFADTLLVREKQWGSARKRRLG